MRLPWFLLEGLAVRHRAVQIRAQIGAVLTAETVVIEQDVEILARLDQGGQRHALALAVGRRTIRHIFLGVKQIGTQGHAVGQGVVGVDRQTMVLVGTHTDRQLGEIEIGRCLLGDRIDRPTRRAATGKTGTRTFRNLDLFDGKALADAHAGITQSVHKHVAAFLVRTLIVAGVSASGRVRRSSPEMRALYGASASE